MIGELRWLFPQPGYHIYFQRPPQALYKQWREGRRQLEERFVIENVRFTHDPQWDKRLFSIQSAHDGNHWVWKLTHGVVRVIYSTRYGAGIGW